MAGMTAALAPMIILFVQNQIKLQEALDNATRLDDELNNLKFSENINFVNNLCNSKVPTHNTFALVQHTQSHSDDTMFSNYTLSIHCNYLTTTNTTSILLKGNGSWIFEH